MPDFAEPQALNRYAYALNNPVNLTDPSGHAPICGHNCQIEESDPFDPPPPPDPKGLIEDWIPRGFRIEGSAVAGVGVDVNIDAVSIKLDPKQTTVLVQVGWQIGLDLESCCGISDFE